MQSTNTLNNLTQQPALHVKNNLRSLTLILQQQNLPAADNEKITDHNLQCNNNCGKK